MKAILEKADFYAPDRLGAQEIRISIGKYLSVVDILFGIVNDAPGYIWVPGKDPVPVDSGWKDAKLDFTGPKKDLLVGLAMREMSELVEATASDTCCGRSRRQEWG
ncbi:hypothetical protein ACSFA8_22655 [Variovorax sp. RT4R15]|uniref:hypothetical protein n=1 Tax=Variovorax sp. RT4R15 TaxID=3443737 RepID=UPI003F470AE7